ncbi:Uncharacterized conserved protein, DUF1501 family [Sphingomonas sp. NFR04]|uniref:DUF1501 domain-containing protein n=1 Tax=Sphingomonas sp. NFR04 TaxID=1566283 RepID=UPI0008E69D9A|nr:DUF1501 domain-containing protein [Sphingomonas sp. NFR04]SFK14056.1 Uncharacterized conserved protein, DUF1501 family [Sphingomonas sp. NFR04]
MMLHRRQLLAAGATALLVSPLGARMAFAAAPTERRFVFLIQRGAADGLGIVAPVGDPAYAGARGDLAADFASAPRLDGMFALHPAMPNTLGLYRAKQALFVHAVASPYRDRSHFDGQNVLETGGVSAYQLKEGWMNRLLRLLPEGDKAIALAAAVPMALRGSVEVASYAPSSLPEASDDLLARVSAMYEGDKQLHPLWQEAMATRMLTGDLGSDGGKKAADTGTLAAKLLSAPGGARIAMIETGGWDTHSGQRGRLGGQLKGLDAMVAALKAGLGPHWDNTLVVVATEFGRTVKANGTGGTDHGTGSVAMLLGGAVQGGRVQADWPGLGDAALYEGRDLKPTTALDVLIASAVSRHFGLAAAQTAKALFPAMTTAAGMEGLVRG